MNGKRRRTAGFVLAVAGVMCALCLGGLVDDATAQPKPEGEMRWALYVTLSAAWLDPAEVVGQLTPFWVLYAIHDALVKPMPGNLMTPSLAASWTLSADQRIYEFKLREGLKFHNGDAFTAEDVKFSFSRAKGSKILREKVREVAIVDPYRVRFHLHEPWPDFMAYYGTLVSGAGWIAPKKYVEKVGVGYLGAVGIRLKMRPMERAAFFAGLTAKKLRGLCVCGSALYGNAASRMSEIVPSDGALAYGGDPDVDALYKQQSRETDRGSARRCGTRSSSSSTSA
jgi:hypothetical protein